MIVRDEYNRDDPERCPWCGTDCDDPRVGRGDQVDLIRYSAWLEDHVPDCEPFAAEAAADEQTVQSQPLNNNPN